MDDEARPSVSSCQNFVSVPWEFESILMFWMFASQGGKTDRCAMCPVILSARCTYGKSAKFWQPTDTLFAVETAVMESAAAKRHVYPAQVTIQCLRVFFTRQRHNEFVSRLSKRLTGSVALRKLEFETLTLVTRKRLKCPSICSEVHE